MEPPDPSSIAPSPPTGAASGGATPAAEAAGRPGPSRSRAVGLWALGAGALAALVSWLLIEATRDSFKPKGAPSQFMGSTFLIAGAEERSTAGTRNAALALGLMGGTVGL